MAITNTIVSSIGSVASNAYVSGILAPVVGIFKTVQIVPVTLAVAVLWGMTTKGPDEQSWDLGDYAVVLPISWVIAHSGPTLSGMVRGKIGEVMA